MEVPFEGGSKSESVPIDAQLHSRTMYVYSQLFLVNIANFPIHDCTGGGVHFYTTHALKLDYGLNLCKVKGIAALSVSNQASFTHLNSNTRHLFAHSLTCF